MILTAATIKKYASLDSPSHRRREGLFMVEGTKAVSDTLGYFELECLAATHEWLEEHPEAGCDSKRAKATNKELRRMSHMVTSPPVIAVYRLPELPKISEIGRAELILALDTIQDPGNLGTIIRTADWFGVRHIVASKETTDCFGTKVVQATMGSLTRVKVIYADLAETLRMFRQEGREIYGTFMNGENLYSSTLTSDGVIVVGNEGKGISEEVATVLSRKITIPPYPHGELHGESLNAAIAASLTIAAFRFH